MRRREGAPRGAGRWGIEVAVLMGWAVAVPDAALAQPGPDAPPRAVAAHDWAALLRADTTAARPDPAGRTPGPGEPRS